MSISTEKKSPRISLVRVFSIALAGILLVFILLSYFTFTRLLSFESTLTDISNKSLPNLIQISQLYSQAATLLESTELLSKSSSRASKRLAEQKLQTNLINIRKAEREIFANEFSDRQLNAITVELEEFSALIEKRLQTINSIELLTQQMYKLNAQAIDLKNQNSAFWVLGFSQASVNVNKALNQTKLQRVRFLFAQLNKQLNELDNISAQEQNKTAKHQLTSQFNTLLFSENGLEALKIQVLRLTGRAIGRENFVHNLIEDYIAQLGFVTNETEQDITQQVADSANEMKKQTQLIGFILIGGVVFLLLIVVLIQQRVLKRISIFNNIVRSESLGYEYQTSLDGNDEIADLAATFKEFTQTIAHQKNKLEQLSMSDGLTGIANRRALDIRLKHDIELSARHKSSLSILLMDIDCFKLYNDNYGHLAGDECLKEVSKIIGISLQRDSDFVARYGGEEFVCVLPNTDSNGAQELAAELIQNFKNRALPHQYSNVEKYVTMSIGIATSQDNDRLTPELVLEQADKALYSVKRTGKNAYKSYESAI